MTAPTGSFPVELFIPSPLSISFEGFNEEAFSILAALKERPTIDTYRAHKDAIRRQIKEPFKRFRDDLVINWVLPNSLPLETERNVFSRLLKNDFGAGGCHHHLWLSFYRYGFRRLSDVQLAHTIRDTGFTTSLYIGDNAPALLQKTREHIYTHEARFLRLVNTVLRKEGWIFRVRQKGGGRTNYLEYGVVMDALPEGLDISRGFWWSLSRDRNVIQNRGRDLLRGAIGAIETLWPLYLFLIDID